MSTQDEEFSTLMQRAREGSEDAFQELVEKYSHHVRRVVRHKLDAAMRSKFDSLDFVQSVWACFFENRQRLLQFGTDYELIGFLAKVARERVIDECRRRSGTRRAVNREEPLDSRDFACAGGTPSQVAIAREHLDKLLRGYSQDSRRIVEMKLDGADHDEIAAELGVSRKTVQRTLRVLERTILSGTGFDASQGSP